MIEVDISNVWGALALPDLLAMEKEIFDAHWKLTEGGGEESPAPGWLELPLREDTEELARIQACAEKIRRDSDVCVVVGMGESILGARAAMELLQGVHRNVGRGKGDPRIYFAGSSLSTRQWNGLVHLLEDQDYSLIVVSKTGTAMEPALAFRGLRWLMERKYGTDGANARIYAVTAPEESALHQMARESGWETFALTAHGEQYSVLTAAGLLPMAVAGIDIVEVLEGAFAGREAYDLRSFENPVWLYAAVRSLLGRSGRQVETLVSFEPELRGFGLWWQQLFGGIPGADIFPAACIFPEERYASGGKARFETMVRFAPGGGEHIIGSDWQDLEGLNCLEGKPLSFVQEQAAAAILSDHVDKDIPVLTMDCGAPDGRTLGELFYFMELARGICACIPGGDTV